MVGLTVMFIGNKKHGLGKGAASKKLLIFLWLFNRYCISEEINVKNLAMHSNDYLFL